MQPYLLILYYLFISIAKTAIIRHPRHASEASSTITENEEIEEVEEVSSTYQINSPTAKQIKIKNSVISGVDHLFACGDIICQRVTEFRVANNYTPNCLNMFLPISYYYLDSSKKKIEAYGLLPLINMGNIIFDKQKNFKNCKLIKRYFFYKIF